MNQEKKYIWCSTKLPNGDLHYVYAEKNQAIALCMHQGYTIDIPEHEVPVEIREVWYRAKQ
jgi:hypothetical protein